MSERKKVALVLGGGGALGCAHIGLIKVLERHNVPIDIVVGTSMGSVVGAGFALGLTFEEMTDLAKKFKTYNFLDMNFDISGLFSGKGVMKAINNFLPDINIEELPKQFACVATDLVSEKAVVLKSGNLRDAVRSSLSIPGVFTPLVKEDMILVDGGVLNNLPEDVAVSMGADIIISCDVLEKFKVIRKPKNMIETIMYSMTLSAKEVQKLKSTHADVVIRPNMAGINPFSFNTEKVELAIKRGERAGIAKIDDILRLINEA